jgi:hypothetical protein
MRAPSAILRRNHGQSLEYRLTVVYFAAVHEKGVPVGFSFILGGKRGEEHRTVERMGRVSRGERAGVCAEPAAARDDVLVLDKLRLGKAEDSLCAPTGHVSQLQAVA